MKPTVYQILPTMAYGDAVSNDALAIAEILHEMGYKNQIYAINIDQRLSGIVKPYSYFLADKKDDIIIFHMSTGSELSQSIIRLPNKNKIMFYHNITPENYFLNYSSVAYELSKTGRAQLKLLNNTFKLSLADSEYNRLELEELGYKNTDILPIILNFDDYKAMPDMNIINKYNDEYINIIFIGRIAPNKKQEDIIKTFYVYNRYINPRSRLFLIGSYRGMERYYGHLKNLINELNLGNVIIPGHITFKEIISYYKIGSVFLSMSEHEGFCVPLLESMIFEVPIIAYESSAIADTLGKSGIIFTIKKYELVAELINIVVSDMNLKNRIIQAQIQRLRDFERDRIKIKFRDIFEKNINK